MSRQALHFGVEEHWIAGTIIRVFNPAKTVADCFKFRNKIGVEVAIEALKESRKTKTTLDELWSAASVRGVTLTVLRSSS
jgi:predicted transcriptional regulator of viral defense system